MTDPLAAESIWEVAREAGLRVSGSSHLPWWKELFPRGFDRYAVGQTHLVNVFDVDGDLDVNLFHPLYVDEAGHRFGAASTSYRLAVHRADQEIAGLLSRVDLTKDVVILTADHGHTASGGHGGAQPEIENVLACFAGPNVVRRDDRARFDGRSTAATLAVLLGLRFPRHMRAGDDGLDVVWEIVDTDTSNVAFVADRRAAIARFRSENARALARWLGHAPATWPALEAREARAQHLRLALAGLAAVAFVVLSFRRRRLDAEAVLRRCAWLGLACAVAWGVHHLVLGDFDFTVINERDRFVPRAGVIALVTIVLGLVAHPFVVRARTPEERVLDLVTVLALLLLANAGHVLAYGWPLGYPLPSQPARYFPFFGAIALATSGLVIAIVLGAIAVRRRALRSK